MFSFLSRWRRAWSSRVTRTKSWRGQRWTGSRVEELEPRRVLAELGGAVWNPIPAVAQPGQSITVNWSVANTDGDQIPIGFNVDFWLSTDAVFSVDDRFLSSQFLPAGFPGFYTLPTQSTTLAMLPANNAYWAQGSDYQILMLVDPYDVIWEWDSTNNFSATSFSISTNNGGGGGGGGGDAQYTDLNQLPETGVAPGAVFSAVATNLTARLRDAAAAQKTLKKTLSRSAPISTSEQELTNLASSISSIGAKVSKLASGKVKSVELAPGVTLAQSDLVMAERYLKYLFTVDSVSPPPPAYYPIGPQLAAVPRAEGEQTGALFNPRDLLPKGLVDAYDKAIDFKKSVEQKIANAEQGLKNFQNNPTKWIGELFGRSGAAQAEAQAEAKAVSEGGTKLADRVNELEQQLAPQNVDDYVATLDSMLTGAPPLFAMASSRLKAVMKRQQASVDQLADQLVNLAAWSRNQATLGRWQGNVTRTSDGLQGTIDFYFKPSSALGNTVSGTLGHTFYVGGKGTGRTTGSFSGTVDEFNVFRGTVTVKNSSGSGTYSVAWQLGDNSISGTLYSGLPLTFNVARAR